MTKFKQIISNTTGKHCDMLPFGSIQNEDRIPPNFDTKDFNFPDPIKKCPECLNNFSKDIPFIKSDQIGDDKETCLRCFEKKYVSGGRENYRECLIKELEWIKNNSKPILNIDTDYDIAKQE